MKPARSRLLALLAGVALAALAGAARAQSPAIDPALGESVVGVRNDALIAVELEVTLFTPPGAGPFPVVVINHGKSPGNNRLQPRARYPVAAREFLRRGYLVVVPMRQGFAGSGGASVGEGCNIEANGLAQARDVRAVMKWLRTLPQADMTRVVMLGQSHGGLTTLAYGIDPDPGVRLLVNFAGGLKYESGNCPWQQALASAYGRFGAATRLPSLWFYGENDSYFPPPVIQPAYRAYVAGGAPARLVAYGPFGVDAHAMFGSQRGLAIWLQPVLDAMAQAQLPVAVQNRMGAQLAANAPPATNFAALDDAAAVPFVRDSGREGYARFLLQEPPRAFAIAPSGAWGWSSGTAGDPQKKALESCMRNSRGSECRLYAVDDDVVWVP